MSDPAPHDRPLMTFALFAYNQEKYIREAVEGAFAQTYEPLEIILSDDCSGDRTFEIMQEMVAAYGGPHEVYVRRNEVNLGTASHFQVVFNRSKGRLFVVAAGDDISVPSRCARIADCWLNAPTNPSCIHSGAVFFKAGCEDAESVRRPRSDSITTEAGRLKAILQGGTPFLSPTCAYSRSVFDNFEPLMGGSIIEDSVLALRSLCTGSVLAIDESLVRIRQQEATSGTGNNINDPVRWNRFVLSRIISSANKIRDAHQAKVTSDVALHISRKYQLQIRNLGGFIVLPTTDLGQVKKLIFFVRYLLFYPSRVSLISRVGNGLLVLGVERRFVGRIGRNSRFMKRILRTLLRGGEKE